MDLSGSFRCVCRICRSYDLSLNWNEDLDEFIRLSYKDCYYKYSHVPIEADRLSQFLCDNCAAGIKNFHLLVEESLETLRLYKKQLAAKRSRDETSSKGPPAHETGIVEDKNIVVGDAALLSVLDEKTITVSPSHSVSKKCSSLKEKAKGLQELDSSIENFEHSIESFESKFDINEVETMEITKDERVLCEDYDVLTSPTKVDFEVIQIEGSPGTHSQRIFEIFHDIDIDLPTGKSITENSSDRREIDCLEFIESDQAETPKELPNFDEKSCKATNTPVMCCYCSKIIYNTYNLKLHEQTHEKNRQRKVTCPTCGVQLYNKRSLANHKKIHDKNRIKKFKCEFCDKAFFNRGSCNVHRRIHLGQMVQCPLCPKQYYRQVELDKHMPSHAHETLNSGKMSKQKKYYVHCKECDKKVPSERFNAHRAVHMNDPLMRCTLCEKDFFSRASGGKHMARVHKRKGGNYDDIAIYYKNKNRPRLSLLMMKHQEDVEPAE